MKTRQIKTSLFASLLVMGGYLVTGCSDSDYDFNNIDATVGFGGDGLELPVSSTDNIQLSEILELEANGTVVADASTNYDYVFRQEGTSVEAAHPFINSILVSRRQSSSGDIALSLASQVRGTRAVGKLTGEGNIFEFSYEGNKPSEVEDLVSAEVSSDINLKVSFQGISEWVTQFDKITLDFPSYMKLKYNGEDVENHQIVLQDVSTANDLQLNISIVGLDFSKSDALGSLEIVKKSTGDKIQMTGNVRMTVEASQLRQGTNTSATIKNELSMSDIKILGATGKFNPSISLGHIGNVKVSGVPDFLKDGNVVVDLYNPIINLQLNSTLDIEGIVGGVLTSVKNGKVIARVEVPEFVVKANGLTHAMICRTTDGLALGDDITPVVVTSLSDLIKTMPDEITFQAHARANKDKVGTFKLGYEGYEVAPSYSIDAPIAFGKDACIEYKDNLDGWNNDIKDLRLADDAYVQLNCNVTSCVPAYLSVEATPIDFQGNAIDKSELEVEVTGVIGASKDGVAATTSPLTVKVTQKKQDAFQKLDGLKFVVSGKATAEDGTAVTGVVLNAKKHTLKLDDIKIKIVGKVIGDFNE